MKHVLMAGVSALKAAGAGVDVERERRVHDRRVDAVFDVTLGNVRATFAVEEKRRAVDAQGRHDANVILRMPDDVSVSRSLPSSAGSGASTFHWPIRHSRSGTSSTSEEPTVWRLQEGCRSG